MSEYTAAARKPFLVIAGIATFFLAVAHATPYTYIQTYVVIGLIVSLIAGPWAIDDVKAEHRKALATIKADADFRVAEAAHKEKDAKDLEQLWRKTLLERSQCFPTLLRLIERLESLRDDRVASQLEHKKHPARKAAAIVSEETKKRREAQLELRRTKVLLNLYELYAPFLLDLVEESPDDADATTLADYTEDERQDAAVNYLTKEEYRRLPTAQRNQLALDRFWSRPKSRWIIGKLYERYIGFLYEQQGYDVEYFGITERYEDLGRDLICRKEDETMIVQCKHWSHFKTIYEKHIFQLFGTAFEYRESHPSEKVTSVFWTSTEISPLAKKISDTLNIGIFANHPLDTTYPSIKCNINPQDGTRIYHLPFDQMYDRTKIDREGEMYCRTVEEAEDAGFRRAFRWKGQRQG